LGNRLPGRDRNFVKLYEQIEKVFNSIQQKRYEAGKSLMLAAALHRVNLVEVTSLPVGVLPFIRV
jgi:hypothetical protein